MRDSDENKTRRRELAEFEDEQRFHKKEWAAQRIGWVALGAVLIGACAGLFGGGPLAHQRLVIGEHTLEFDRFVRHGAATEWTLRPVVRGDTTNEIVVRLPSRLLEKFEVRAIAPEPSSTALEGEHHVFRFDAAHVHGTIVYHVEPEGVGPASGSISVGELRSATMSQFIYP